VARPSRQTRAELIERLAQVFLRFGFEGASLSRLSEATGLSKASLYHHFPGGKADMARHVLGRAGVDLQARVFKPLHGRGDPRERLHQSLAATADYYAGDIPVCLMNVLTMGEGAEHFGGDIEAGMAVWWRGIAQVLVDGGVAADIAEARARDALAQVQGALVLARVERNRQALTSCLQRLERDLLELI